MAVEFAATFRRPHFGHDVFVDAATGLHSRDGRVLAQSRRSHQSLSLRQQRRRHGNYEEEC